MLSRRNDPGKPRRKKRGRSSSVQEARPEGGKFSVQSPAIQLCHFVSTFQGEPNGSVSVTPLLVIEVIAPKGSLPQGEGILPGPHCCHIFFMRFAPS